MSALGDNDARDSCVVRVVKPIAEEASSRRRISLDVANTPRLVMTSTSVKTLPRRSSAEASGNFLQRLLTRRATESPRGSGFDW